MFLGIDVSKKTLDAALLDSSEAERAATRKPRHKVFDGGRPLADAGLVGE